MPRLNRETLVLTACYSFHDDNVELNRLSAGALIAEVNLVSERNALRPPRFWSARVSTGIFGEDNCPAGRRGPNELGEIVFGVGPMGLQGIIALGFVACPVCRKDWQQDFPTADVSWITRNKYHSPSTILFDQRAMPFDARRVNYEEISVVAGTLPNRVYVPLGLDTEAVEEMRKRFGKMPRTHDVTVGSYQSGGNIDAYFILTGQQEG